MHSLSHEAFQKISAAAQDRSRVSGATHRFYRYPARFSPAFVRACIKEFTEPGDLVVDPFVGGGTTAVEAMLSGRRSFGSDINALATFVSRVKTTPIPENELECLQLWFETHLHDIKVSGGSAKPTDWDEAGYFRNVSCSATWRHQRLIQFAIEKLEPLPNERCEEFARCAILRTAQLALDGKKTLPKIERFRSSLRRVWREMFEDAQAFSKTIDPQTDTLRPFIVRQSASQIDRHEFFQANGRPKLAVTSPPYPGVHILYHRWQVQGRRETPVPYWIANRLDGERCYTLGNRHEKELRGYFDNLRAAFASIARLLGSGGLLVQIVGFAQPDWQLPRYLEVMDECGLDELNPAETLDVSWADETGRLWRDVPNRKWHASMQAKRSASKESVLIHRRAS